MDRPGLELQIVEFCCDKSWQMTEYMSDLHRMLDVVSEKAYARLPKEFIEHVREVLHMVTTLESLSNEWYQYNEDLYNRVVCGAMYKNGRKIAVGIQE